MLTVVAVAVGLAAGMVAGGRLRCVTRRHLRRWWLLVAGLGLEALSGHLGTRPAVLACLTAGYACLIVFVAANRLMVGTGVVITGLLLNATVIAIDAGMPVKPAAVVAAGLAHPGQPVPPPAGFRHHLQRPGDHLLALDDRLALRPLHEVLSIGDLVLTVGIADVAANLVMPATAAERRRRRRSRLASARRAAGVAWGSLMQFVVQPRGADATRVSPDFYGLARHRNHSTPAPTAGRNGVPPSTGYHPVASRSRRSSDPPANPRGLPAASAGEKVGLR